MPRENNSHVLGWGRFKFTSSSALQMTQNSTLNNMFTMDSHVSLMIDEWQTNEVILSKGHPTNPALGSWAIINENKYLKIVFHEVDGVHSLVFKSNAQILNTRYRKLISFNFLIANNNIELFLDSLPIAFSLDTSQGNYRTNINQFTGIRVTTDDIKVGRGTSLPYGTFALYYDLLENIKLSQAEINTIFQPIQDNRSLPPVGKILFSRRLNSGANYYSIYECNEDGTDPQLKVGDGGANLWQPRYAFNPSDTDIVYVRFPNGDGNGGYPYLFSQTLGIVSLGSGSTSGLDTITKGYNGLIVWDQFVSFGAYTSPSVLMTDSGVLYSSFLNGGRSELHNCLHPTDDDIIAISQGGYFTGEPSKISIFNRNLNTLVTIFSANYLNIGFYTNIYNIRWNKQATKLVFLHRVNTSDYTESLCIINVDGTGFQQLTDGSYIISGACFSPDGSKVLYSKYTVSNISHYMVIRDLNTNQEINISNNSFSDIGYDWK